jgi:hypothetical protein
MKRTTRRTVRFAVALAATALGLAFAQGAIAGGGSAGFLTPSQAQAAAVAEARALGVYRGMTAQQAYDWSVGVCSYADKPSSCYLTPAEAVAQSYALATAMGANRIPPSDTTVTTASIGFSWGDAGIGAAATLGFVLLFVGLGVTVVRRRVRSVSHA